MDANILNFISTQKNLTLATSINNQPYCANCFYAFNKNDYSLIFKSSADTEHIKQLKENPFVGGTILPDISKVGNIQGIQFKGVYGLMTEKEIEEAKSIYYSKFPFARAVSGEFWKIKVDWIKMTDNTLGFGKKLIWNKTE